jgi:GT2 family glycosyltransferase
MSNVLIAIILRNNLALSKLAIRSAMTQQPPCDIILVNNDSSDGTAAYIAAKNVATISFQKQVSLATCWNTALRAAWRMKYEAVALCNNDIRLREDAIALMMAEGSPFVSCVSVNNEEQMGVTGDRDIETLRTGKRDRPDFSCFVIRKSVTDKVGYFDEDCWPAFTEDSRYHVRCHRAGVRCVCIDVPFYHEGSATLKESSEKEAIIIRRGADRNRQAFRKLYGCVPGETEKYDALFSPEMFGIDDPINRLKRQSSLGLGPTAAAAPPAPEARR